MLKVVFAKRLCYNISMEKEAFKRGFTLVELSLSMVFIGVLSLLIVFIISDTVASYRRGLTIGRINTIGMEIVDDMRTAVQNASSAPATDLCEEFYANEEDRAQSKCIQDGATNFVTVTKLADVKMKNGETLSNIPVFGAFCSGTYSYIWNSGYFDSNDSTVLGGVTPAYLKYRDEFGRILEYPGDDDSGGDKKPFRLLKIRDEQRSVCVSVARPYSSGSYDDDYEITQDDVKSEFDISNGYGSILEPPEDLILADGDNDLVLYNFDVAKPAESSTRGNMFYSISFILGTKDGGINITVDNKKCATPNDYEMENYNYCAVNKFNFAVQASGE